MPNKTASLSAPGYVALTGKPSGSNVVSVGLNGTFTGLTFTFEASDDDGTNYYPVAAVNKATRAWLPGGTGITPSNGTVNGYEVQGRGASAVRVNVSAISTGSATFRLRDFIDQTPAQVSPLNGGTFASPTLTTATLTGPTIIGDSSNPLYRRATTRTNAQPTPTAESGTSTSLTAAKLLTGIITQTQTAAVTATLDTGANLDTALPNAVNNDAFDWSLINTGSSSGAATVTAATGHTIVGAAVVAIGTTGYFRTRKTGTATWVTYRMS